MSIVIVLIVAFFAVRWFYNKESESDIVRKQGGVLMIYTHLIDMMIGVDFQLSEYDTFYFVMTSTYKGESVRIVFNREKNNTLAALIQKSRGTPEARQFLLLFNADEAPAWIFTGVINKVKDF